MLICPFFLSIFFLGCYLVGSGSGYFGGSDLSEIIMDPEVWVIPSIGSHFPWYPIFSRNFFSWGPDPDANDVLEIGSGSLILCKTPAIGTLFWSIFFLIPFLDGCIRIRIIRRMDSDPANLNLYQTLGSAPTSRRHFPGFFAGFVFLEGIIWFSWGPNPDPVNVYPDPQPLVKHLLLNHFFPCFSTAN